MPGRMVTPPDDEDVPTTPNLRTDDVTLHDNVCANVRVRRSVGAGGRRIAHIQPARSPSALGTAGLSPSRTACGRASLRSCRLSPRWFSISARAGRCQSRSPNDLSQDSPAEPDIGTERQGVLRQNRTRLDSGPTVLWDGPTREVAGWAATLKRGSGILRSRSWPRRRWVFRCGRAAVRREEGFGPDTVLGGSGPVGRGWLCSRAPNVAVMQATDFGDLHDGAELRRRGEPDVWRILVE